jgi:hypothetical protein
VTTNFNGEGGYLSSYLFFTSKEDHTYVRGVIYQRVIGIRTSKKDRKYNGPKKDSKGTKGQTTIFKDL